MEPQHISAYTLTEQAFIEDVARVFQILLKIDHKPITTQIYNNRDGFNIAIRDNQNNVVGAIWADRSTHTHIIPADYVYDVIRAYKLINVRYAMLVTCARINVGAKAVAKQNSIHLVDGERFEQMRAKAYGWDKPLDAPIYFEKNPLPIEQKREATDDELKAIYNKVGYKSPTRTGGSRTAPTVVIHDDKMKHIQAIKKPSFTQPTLAHKRDDNEQFKPQPSNNQIGELSPEEQAVILAWRRGDKLKAAKIILND